jgi:hypothetical protein
VKDCVPFPKQFSLFGASEQTVEEATAEFKKAEAENPGLSGPCPAGDVAQLRTRLRVFRDGAADSVFRLQSSPGRSPANKMSAIETLSQDGDGCGFVGQLPELPEGVEQSRTPTTQTGGLGDIFGVQAEFIAGGLPPNSEAGSPGYKLLNEVVFSGPTQLVDTSGNNVAFAIEAGWIQGTFFGDTPELALFTAAPPVGNQEPCGPNVNGFNHVGGFVHFGNSPLGEPIDQSLQTSYKMAILSNDQETGYDVMLNGNTIGYWPNSHFCENLSGLPPLANGYHLAAEVGPATNLGEADFAAGIISGQQKIVLDLGSGENVAEPLPLSASQFCTVPSGGTRIAVSPQGGGVIFSGGSN